MHVTFALGDYYQEVFLKVSLFFFPFPFLVSISPLTNFHFGQWIMTPDHHFLPVIVMLSLSHTYTVFIKSIPAKLQHSSNRMCHFSALVVTPSLVLCQQYVDYFSFPFLIIKGLLDEIPIAKIQKNPLKL